MPPVCKGRMLSPSPEGEGRVLCQGVEVNAGVLFLPPAPGPVCMLFIFILRLMDRCTGFNVVR